MIERGHRILAVTRKGRKVVTIPLAARRASDRPGHRRTLRRTGLPGPDSHRLDRHGAARIARQVARRAGITKAVGPHTLRHAFVSAAHDAGALPRDVQEAASHADPRTTMRYDRARASLDRHAAYIVAAYVAGTARQALGKPRSFRIHGAAEVPGKATRREQHKPHEPPYGRQRLLR